MFKTSRKHVKGAGEGAWTKPRVLEVRMGGLDFSLGPRNHEGQCFSVLGKGERRSTSAKSIRIYVRN